MTLNIFKGQVQSSCIFQSFILKRSEVRECYLLTGWTGSHILNHNQVSWHKVFFTLRHIKVVLETFHAVFGYSFVPQRPLLIQKLSTQKVHCTCIEWKPIWSYRCQDHLLYSGTPLNMLKALWNLKNYQMLSTPALMNTKVSALPQRSMGLLFLEHFLTNSTSISHRGFPLIIIIYLYSYSKYIDNICDSLHVSVISLRHKLGHFFSWA